MDNRYTALSKVPSDALKEIGFGKLKGKSDINPQWKIEAMTEQFGLCGIGWYFDITDVTTIPLQDGQLLIYMTVKVYVKEGDGWSMPAVGCGGDFLVQLEKGQLKGNDEGYKMCLTDALGNAFKCFGVAGDVYRGRMNGATKYSRVPSPTATVATTPTEQNSGNIHFCAECNAEISEKVANFSNSKYGEPLCYACQKKRG